MHRIGTGLFASLDNLICLKITVCRTHSAKGNRFISELDMLCGSICIRINSHCGNAHLFRCPHDTACNFPSICYQDFFKHIRLFLEHLADQGFEIYRGIFPNFLVGFC